MNPTADPRDTSAERFLRLVRAKRRGTLKVYLGLAAGVGKTFGCCRKPTTCTSTA